MIGQTLSHYEIIEKLGEGGMGVVYKARDLRLQRFVAVKVLPAGKASDPISRKRLLREAQSASALNHPNIVTIYDIGSVDDNDFLVMEYVEGVPLRQLIALGPLSVQQAVEYATQMADALAAAHKAGIIHRDLKPGNVMISSSGRIKLLDFGLAKPGQLDPLSDSTSLSQSGAVVGTLTYMPPEQALGQVVGPRADIFSFGVVLHEMLTSELPFEGVNIVALLRSIQYDEPRPLLEARPDAPAALQHLIRKTLMKNPQDRYASMQDIVTDLRGITTEAPAKQASAPGRDRPGFDRTISRVLPPESRPRSGSASRAASPPAPGSERASIAVLPFRCLSSDPEDSYTAAGIATEIISALSGVPGIRVAPHLGSFGMPESGLDMQKLAADLNVRYVLTGSLRRAGKRIRVIAELSDAIEGSVIWSRTYDRGMEDVFAVQEDIARSVVGASGGQIIRARAEHASRSPTESLDAWGLVRKAYHFWNYAFRLEGVSEALDLLRRAVQLDPNYASAHAFLALYLIQRVMVFISPDRAGDRAESLAAAERAFELAPGDPEVLENVGVVWFCTGKSEKSVTALRRAVKIAPFNLVAWGYLAMDLGWGGDEKEVAEAQGILDRLIADTPDHPSLPYWYYFKAGACFRQENYELAAECAKKTMELQPRYIVSHIAYANAIGALGRLDEARQLWSQVLSVNPYINQEAYTENLLAIARTPERVEQHIRGLKLAGIFK